MISSITFQFFTSIETIICYSVLPTLQAAAAKDPDAAFFKKLDGFQQCELTELKAGTHVFAVYGRLTYKCWYFVLS